jgi:DNA-binding XRE family transcriptional regulator
MAQLAALLKAEITRLARKEIRAEVQALKKASVQHRGEIASLKRQLKDQQRVISRLGRVNRGGRASAAATRETDSDSPKLRFRSSGFATLRQKLGLSAAEMGKLVQVTQQTIYHWEKGSSKPRASQLARIAEIRKLGKRSVQEQLAG